MRPRFLALLAPLLLATAACAGDARTASVGAQQAAAGGGARPEGTRDGDSTARGEVAGREAERPAAGAIPDSIKRGKAIVRGIYVNRWATQSPARMRKMIAIADSTEVNALVLERSDWFRSPRGRDRHVRESSSAREGAAAA